MSLDLYARMARHAGRAEPEQLLAALAAGREDPNQIAETLRRHHLLGLVCAVLGPRGGSLVAAPAARRPARGAGLEALIAAYGEIRRAFDAGGIASMLLKGFYFAHRLYGGLERRPQYDVDLLVKRRDFRGAERLLERLGFARKWRDLHSHTLSRGAVHVDLHHAPRRSPAYSFDEARVWQRSVEARAGDLVFRTLSDEDYVTMLATSAFEDVGFGKGHLKQALDLYLLLGEHDARADWEAYFGGFHPALLAVVTNALALVVDVMAAEAELEGLRAALERRRLLIDHAGREQALALLFAPRGSVDNLLWFGRIYPGSVLLYRARFWMRTFPRNLRGLDAGWLRRNAVYLRRSWRAPAVDGLRPAQRREDARGAAPARRTLGCGALVIDVASNDAATADWLAEVLAPWLRPAQAGAEWQVRLSACADDYARRRAERPADAAPRVCFAFDQRVLSLPAWPADGRVVFADDERSCLLAVGPSRVDLIADPRTRRWRITAMWLLHEIVATRLRRTQLDLHAAAAAAGGRALLVSGAKGAGKTSVSFHLLRSRRFRPVANERAFVAPGGPPFAVHGVPTAVRIRPPTLSEFPELRRGLPAVERPYLHTLEELAVAAADGSPAAEELWLSPAQLLRQFAVEPLATAPLGAIVFPDVRPDAGGWALERLEPERLEAALWANLYGSPLDRRAATIFEELDGGPASPPRSLAAALAAAVPGYRLVLGPDAYARPDFALGLEEILR